MTKTNVVLTEEQALRIEELRMTTIAGNTNVEPKTEEQMIHSVVEYGIRAIESQRKQYQRQRAALRAFAK